MERIYLFLPSILILACIAGATHLYLKLVIKRFGDKLKSVEWHEKNKRKLMWTVSIPCTEVRAPAVEELIFRAPLIVAFSTISSVAWYAIFASGGLFALAHCLGKEIYTRDVLSARKKGTHKSDNVVAEINRLRHEKGKMVMVRKVGHVVFALPPGILAGYYGIKYQSIWVSFGIHSVWSLIVPPLLSLLMFVGMFIFSAISSLWDRVR